MKKLIIAIVALAAVAMAKPTCQYVSTEGIEDEYECSTDKWHQGAESFTVTVTKTLSRFREHVVYADGSEFTRKFEYDASIHKPCQGEFTRIDVFRIDDLGILVEDSSKSDCSLKVVDVYKKWRKLYDVRKK